MPIPRIVLVDAAGDRIRPSVPVRLTAKRATAVDGTRRAWSLLTGEATFGDTRIDFEACPREVVLAHERCVRQREAREARPTVDWAEVRRMWDAGASDVDIAAAVGRSTQTVRDWRKREGLPAQRDRG